MSYGKSIILTSLLLPMSFSPAIALLVSTPVFAQSSPSLAKQQANQLLMKGIEQFKVSQLAPALQTWQAALKIYRQINDREGEGLVIGNLGLLYSALGNYPKAIEYQNQRLVIARELNDTLGTSRALGNLGGIYYVQGNYSKAIEYHQQSLTLFQKNNNQLGIGRSLGNLAVAYYSQRNYNKASEYYQKSLPIFRALNDRFEESKVLGNIGLTYQVLGDNTTAITNFQKSIVISRELQYRQGEGKVLSNLGDSFLRLGQFSEAEVALRQSIAIWESLRTGLTDSDKVSLAETQAKTYQLLQEALVRQNRADEALEVAERGRGRALAELLASQLKNKSIAEIQAVAQSPNIENIRRIAKAQKATLVEYSIINPQQLYIWVVKPTGEVTFKISKLEAAEPIAQLVSETRGSISAANRSKRNSASQSSSVLDPTFRKLHKALIEPIESDLPADPNQRIIFLPQGELFSVPFAALQDTNGKYLIEKHTLSTAPSIQTLKLTHEKAKTANTKGNILVVGDPTMPVFEGTQLTPLPGARQEAIDIAKIFNIQPLLGDQATKATVLNQMKTASIVHLATHGLLNTIKGEVPGAIALAANAQDNGFLSSSEIFDLKLTSDLVVLSACDTGGGEIKSDGVIGLSRSLIAAGVPSIVVSLWAVNDDSTSVLMSDFYQNLKTNPNKAQSLRNAMLNTMKKYPSPRDWAAFTLVGESDRTP